LIIRGEFALLY